MADISFYKYLEAAFRYKLFNSEGQRATLDTHFKYLNYNLAYKRIFFYARRVLPKFYNNEFPDTEEGNLQMARDFIQKLDRHQDLQLERLFNPTTALPENGIIIKEAVSESQIPASTKISEPVTVGVTPPAGHPPTTHPSIISTIRAAAVLNPSIAKPLTSRAGIFFQRNVGKYLTVGRVGTGISMGIGAIAGSILGPAGTFAGAGVGALMPSFIRGGGGRFLGNIGNGAINAGLGISNQISTGSLIKLPPKKFWAFIGIIFLLVGVGVISAVFTPPGEEQPTAEAAPVSASLTSCQFTRGDRNPPAESYQSPVLLSYFQQASQISSVPAQVLAAIARVESPTITSKTDADLPALSSTTSCPRSQTGALGIMQLQPPSTRGYIQPAIDKGASYLGKTADQLTEADFCDLRSNIIIASGFILKKLQLAYGIGDGNQWDPSWTNNKDVLYKLAEGYYGCLEYGGPDPLKCGGPYNYGDDLWSSIQSCQPPQVPPYTAGAGSGIISCPLNNGVITAGSEDAGGHCSPGYQTDYPCSEPDVTGRATAIDLQGTDRMVFLPNIGGNVVNWFVEKVDTDTSYLQQGVLVDGSYSVIARAEEAGKIYRIRFVHIESPNVQQGQLASSATPVGPYRTRENHVHITIQEDGVFKPGDLYFNLCK